MKHPSARQLYNYWNHLRGDQKAPRRGALDPSEIRAILGDTFLLEVVSGHEFRFRLAGTRICSAFCRELKGHDFLEFWSGEDRISILNLMDAVINEAAAGSLGIEGENERGQLLPMEVLLLPLKQNHFSVDRIVGVLAPSDPPYWLGIHPIVHQRITSLRIIRPDAADVVVSLPRTGTSGEIAAPAPTRRPNFVVVEGGKR